MGLTWLLVYCSIIDLYWPNPFLLHNQSVLELNGKSQFRNISWFAKKSWQYPTNPNFTDQKSPPSSLWATVAWQLWGTQLVCWTQWINTPSWPLLKLTLRKSISANGEEAVAITCGWISNISSNMCWVRVSFCGSFCTTSHLRNCKG